MKKYFGLSIILLVLIAVGCKPSRREMLTTKYWKMKSLKQDAYFPLPNGDSTNDLLLLNPFPCVLDNHIKFSGDGSVVQNESVLKCDSLAPQEIVRGTWQFSDEETFLFFTDTIDNFEYAFTIEAFDPDYFRASYPRNDVVFTVEYISSNP